jgi:hypothetical protein
MNRMLELFFVLALSSICLLAQAAWQCSVISSFKRESWIGVGPTRATAIENAIKSCTKNSIYIKNCTIQGCFQK